MNNIIYRKHRFKKTIAWILVLLMSISTFGTLPALAFDADDTSAVQVSDDTVESITEIETDGEDAADGMTANEGTLSDGDENAQNDGETGNGSENYSGIIAGENEETTSDTITSDIGEDSGTSDAEADAGEVSSDKTVSGEAPDDDNPASEMEVSLQGEETGQEEDTNEPGTVDGVYQIDTAAELAWFAENTSVSDAVLTDDIDLSEICSELAGVSWTPIKDYSGTFDGDYHTISGLYINCEEDADTADYKGLFANITGGTVKNLIVKGSVTGRENIGGIVGLFKSGTIEQCASYVDVTGTINVGGIAGYIYVSDKSASATVTECLNLGDITGSSKVECNAGGIAGYTYTPDSKRGKIYIQNCANRGTVSGYDALGGLVGRDRSTAKAFLAINSSYSSGIVTTGNTSAITLSGAIVGYFYGAGGNADTNSIAYLDSSCDNATGLKTSNGKYSLNTSWVSSCAKSDADMKSPQTVQLLGEAFTVSCGEYPALCWEKEFRTLKGHSFEQTVTSPTCTAGGFTSYTCRECGYSYISSEGKTEALSHAYDEATHICSRCNELETYPVTFSGSRIEQVSGGSSVGFGTDYTAYIAVIDSQVYGYSLPDDITVTVGGVALDAFEYDAATGKIVIPGEAVSGAVTINADGKLKYYKVYVYDNNEQLVYEGDLPAFTILKCTSESPVTLVGGSLELGIPAEGKESDECYSYSFDGWSYGSGAGKQIELGGEDSLRSSLALYPVYKSIPRVYSVTAGAVDANISIAAFPTSASYGTDLQIPISVDSLFMSSQISASVIRDGKVLLSGSDYIFDADTQKLTVYGTTITGNLEINLSIDYQYYNQGFFDSNGKLIDGTWYSVKQGDTLITPAGLAAEYTDENGNIFTFEGWSLKPNGEICELPDRVSSKCDYYAIYSSETKTYNIEFYDYDGTTLLNGDSTSYIHRSSLTAPDNYTSGWSDDSHNYIFLGWSETQDGRTCTIPELAVSDAVYYAVYEKEAFSYEVSFMLSNAAVYRGSDKAYADASYEAVLRGTGGCGIPDSVSVSIGGIAYSGYVYNVNTGKLTIKAADITGNIDVCANGVPMPFTVSYNLTNMTVSDGAVTASYGEEYIAKIVPSEGYTVNENVTVLIGGRTAIPNRDYVYTSEVEIAPSAGSGDSISSESAVTTDAGVSAKIKYGLLKIYAASVTGDIEIQAYASPKIDISDDSVILTDTTITEGGIYYVTDETMAVVEIRTTEKVTLKGLGMSPAGNSVIGTKGTDRLSVTCLVPGVSLEIENICVTKPAGSSYSILDFVGDGNTLTLSGSNYLYYNYTNYSKATVHVGRDTSLTIGGTGTLLFGAAGQGAGIGGNSYEICGDITVDSGTYFGYLNNSYGPASLIGGGYHCVDNCGTITVNGGSFSLGSSGRLTLLGDVNSTAKLRLNGGDMNLYLSPGASEEGKNSVVRVSEARVQNASVRVFEWLGPVKDTYTSVIRGLDSLTDVTDAEGSELHCLAVDLSGVPLSSDGTYSLDINGEKAYRGYAHRYAPTAETDRSAGLFPHYGSWSECSDESVYLYRSAENCTVSGELLSKTYFWNGIEKNFTENQQYDIIDGSDVIDFSFSRQNAPEGSVVTVSAIENTDYRINRLGYYSENPKDITYAEYGSTSFSFVMPAGDVTVIADTDEAKSYEISVSASENGSVSVEKCVKANGVKRSGTDTAKKGDTIYLDVSGKAGYGVQLVTYTRALNDNMVSRIEKNSDGVYSFTMPEDDIIVAAVFYEAEPIKITVSGGGGVIGYDVPVGADGVINLVPDEGWGVVGVTVSAISGGAVTECTPGTQDENGRIPYSFIMPEGGVSVQAVFGKLHNVDIAVMNKAKAFLANDPTTFIREIGSAAAGASVTATVAVFEPDDHVESVNISYKDESGKENDAKAEFVSDSGELYAQYIKELGTYATVTYENYSFIMPDTDVTLSADIKAYAAEINVVGSEYGSADFQNTHNKSGHYVNGEYVTINGEYIKSGRDIDLRLTAETDCYSLEPSAYYIDETGERCELEAVPSSYSGVSGKYIYYCYIMPKHDITIDVEFLPKNAHGITLDKSGEQSGIFKVDHISVAGTGETRRGREVALKNDIVYIYAGSNLENVALTSLYYTIDSEEPVSSSSGAAINDESAAADIDAESDITEGETSGGAIGAGSDKTSTGSAIQNRYELIQKSGSTTVWYLYMPESDVTVHAEFSAKHQLILDNVYGKGSVYFPKEKGDTGCWQLPGGNICVTGAGIEGYRFAGLTYTPEADETVTQPAMQLFPATAVETESADGMTVKSYVANVTMADEDMHVDAYFMKLYSVSAGAVSDNGKLVFSSGEAVEGETVTVTPVAISSRYAVSHMYYVSKSAIENGESGSEAEDASFDAGNTVTSGAVEIEADKDGVYSFVMPASDVQVFAEFALKSENNPVAVSIGEDMNVLAAGSMFAPNGKGVVTADVSSARPGDTVTVTVRPSRGSYTGYGAVMYYWKEYDEIISAAAINTDESGLCTYGGSGQEYTYTFEVPETDSVEIVTRFTSETVWDGITIDISWYNEDSDYFELETPAQLMGAAALVNGLYNEEINYIIGEKSDIVVRENSNEQDDESESDVQGSNRVSSSTYYLGSVDFCGCTLVLANDMDMGGEGSGKSWSGARYMPIGGQYMMCYTDYDSHKTDGLSHLSSAFCGVLDGGGHSITNVYCDRYVSGENYGDSQSIGLIGRLGCHELSSDTSIPVNPTVRNIVLESGYVYGRRSVGGIVGKVGQNSAGLNKDGTVGCIIENCINKAAVRGTDKKGTGGVAGSSWYVGIIRNCANFGDVENKYQEGTPVGGIAGTNEFSITGCYSVGKITSNDDSSDMAMGIGSKNAGTKTVAHCKYLEGSADGGYYYNGAEHGFNLEADKSYMKSHDFVKELNYAGDVWVSDSNANDGYPSLWYQTESNALSSGTVTITQPADGGGTITGWTLYGAESKMHTGSNKIENGTTIKLTAVPDVGMVLDHYILNGKAIEGNIVNAFKGAEISAVFRELKTIQLYLPDDITTVTSQSFNSAIYAMQVTKAGVIIGEDGTLVSVTDYKPSLTDVMEDESGKYINIFEGDIVHFIGKVNDGAVPVQDGKGYGSISFYVTEYDSAGAKLTRYAYTINDYTVSENAYSAKLEAVVALTSDKWRDMADTVWYEAGAPYHIKTPEELAGLALIVNGLAEENGIARDDFSGDTVYLDNDISLANPDMSGEPCYWDAIGKLKNSTVPFAGTFDGQGFTVSDIAFDDFDSGYLGLFGYLTGTVKNTKTAGKISLEYNDAAAGIVACLNGGTVTDCVNAMDIRGGAYTGGVVSILRSGTVKGCSNKGAISSGSSGVGGIIGAINAADGSTITVTDCHNEGTVGALGNVGGIVGFVSSAVNGKSEITLVCSECTNSGDITCRQNYAGGIVGSLGGIGKINDCKNSGNVTGMSSSICVAGIVGYIQSSASVSGSENSGSITGMQYTAGIAGRVQGNLEDCSNSGAVSGYSDHTAGIVAYAEGRGCSIKDCENKGNIQGAACTAGIASETVFSAKIDSCTNSGAVSGIWSSDGVTYSGGFTGGIVGKAAGGIIKNCTNTESSQITGGGDCVGGIIAYASEGSDSYGQDGTLTVESCKNNGLVTAKAGAKFTGGIAGEVYFSGTGIKFQRCSNTGSVVGGSTGSYTGGIAGGVYVGTGLRGSTEFYNDTNLGSVSGGMYTAGITGRVFNELEGSGSVNPSISVRLNSCTNGAGSSVIGGDCTGGIAGELAEGSPQVISCLNYGSVTGSNCVGGSVGRISMYSTHDYLSGLASSIKNTYNYGSVTGIESVGGSIGAMEVNTSNSGGLVSVTADTCWNNGTVSGRTYIGGVLGSISQTVSDMARNTNVVVKVSNSGNGLNSSVAAESDYAGGFAGYVNSYSLAASACYNKGIVKTGGSWAGGIVGYLCGYNKGENCKFTGCVNDEGASVEAVIKYAGGIVGQSAGGIIEKCINYASVSAGYGAGGVAGYISEQGTVRLCGCERTASVTAAEASGGVVGVSRADITGCYNRGSTSGGGGIAGKTESGVKINFCYSNVTGTDGLAETSAGTLANAYSTGTGSTQESSGVYYSDYGVESMKEADFVAKLNAGSSAITQFLYLQGDYNDDLPVLDWESFDYSVVVYDEYEGNVIREDTVQRGGSYDLSDIGIPRKECPIDGYGFDFVGWRCDGHLYSSDDVITNIKKTTQVYAEFREVKLEDGEVPGEEPGSGSGGDASGNPFAPSDDSGTGDGNQDSGNTDGTDGASQSGSGSSGTGTNTGQSGSGTGSGSETGGAGSGSGAGTAAGTGTTDSENTADEDILSVGDSESGEVIIPDAMVALVETPQATVDSQQQAVADMNAYFLNAVQQEPDGEVEDSPMRMILRLIMIGLLSVGMGGKLAKFYGHDMTRSAKPRRQE